MLKKYACVIGLALLSMVLLPKTALADEVLPRLDVGTSEDVLKTPKKQKVKKRPEPPKPISVDVCDATIIFLGQPQAKQQDLKLTASVSMALSQYLATQQSRFGAKVATNVICQTLHGASYAGTEEEWAQFIQHASTELQKSGAQKLRLELMGEKTKLFTTTLPSKEYRFFGEFQGKAQAIYNVAILDKASNTVYIISVSGAEKAEKAIAEEFTRVTQSFVLNK